MIATGTLITPSLGNQGTPNSSSPQVGSTSDCEVYYGTRVGPFGCYGSDSLCHTEGCNEIVEPPES